MHSHDRAGGRRTDAAWLEEVWADPATRVVVLASGRFPLNDDSQVRWISPEQAPDGDRLFLGLVDGVPYFAVEAGEDAIDTTRTWEGLRKVGQLLSAQDAGLLIHAIALAEWHQAHRHCPRCGGALIQTDAGHAMRCAQCDRQHFPRTDPAVIMLVTDGDRALLGRNQAWPPGRFSTLAGFVDPGESLEQAVAREVLEEVGVEVADVTYFGNQPWPFPASLMVGFFARAVGGEIDVDGAEISEARWFTREELRAQAEDGTIKLPSGISISRALIEAWYGAELPGEW
ncbi:MAG: NAD(+) diphosphatase [Nocardioidaceae bacterium]|nr:MAG: NAD(+) diphosphatase [Nocardioidaceae bacterium]